jgi:glycosyltransferase involved in cell wall biosynthesis
MTVLYAGRLVPYKCADIVVQAFADSEILRNHQLIVVGDGPDRTMIEQIVTSSDLHHCVEVRGRVEHGAVEDLMHEHEVFAFPSIRELGASVVVEAMGAGMCPVVVDYGAPGAYIDDTRGVKLHLTDKKTLIDDMRSTLERLAGDPAKRISLGNAAHEYVKTRHSWNVKAMKIVQVYEWLLGRSSDRPNFHTPP